MAKLMEAPGLGHPGGIGGFGKDDSDNLEDRNYAELFIEDEDNFKLLSKLDILTNENKAKYQYLVTDIAELTDYGYEAVGLGSAMQRINSVFAAMRIPYLALTYTSPKVQAVKKVVKRGKDIGKEKKVKEADCIKIFKYAEDFDPARYATTEAGRTGKDGTVIDHETPTDGVQKRVDKWIEEVASEEFDDAVLKAVGFEVK